MGKSAKEIINGYGIVLRFITPVMVGLILWIVASLYSNIQHVMHNMVYKCDYAEDLEYTRQCLERLNKRVDDLMKGGK